MWKFEYDTEQPLVVSILPLGRRTELTYDTAGARRSQGNVLTDEVTSDSRGTNGSSATLSTTIQYDNITNQPVRIVDPRGAVTAIGRRSNGFRIASKRRKEPGSDPEFPDV